VSGKGVKRLDEKAKAIYQTVRNTEILRSPKNKLSTFGTTRIHYYVLTDPVCKGLLYNDEVDTVVREGYVHAEKPKIITPFYLKNVFEGFEHGSEYSQSLIEAYGASEPGIMYNYRNDFKEMNIVSTPITGVFENINENLEKDDEPFSTIIKGDAMLWDLSLMIFIYSFTGISLKNNISELHSMGLLHMDRSGVPREGRLHIEELFRNVKSGKTEPAVLKKELDAWGVFAEYEDRFLGLFRKD
jgi:hypothetical protein